MNAKISQDKGIITADSTSKGKVVYLNSCEAN